MPGVCFHGKKSLEGIVKIVDSRDYEGKADTISQYGHIQFLELQSAPGGGRVRGADTFGKGPVTFKRAHSFCFLLCWVGWGDLGRSLTFYPWVSIQISGRMGKS